MIFFLTSFLSELNLKRKKIDSQYYLTFLVDNFRSASPATRTRSMRRKRQAQKPIEELSENDEADTVEASQSGATDSGPYSEGKVDVSPPRTTPVLKISFGHGSVMKIKAKLNGPSEQASTLKTKIVYHLYPKR